MSQPNTHQPDLRKLIAHALVRYDWNAGLSGRDTPSEHHYGEADAVLAVLPEPVSRAAVLAEAIAALEQERDATDVNVAEYPRYDRAQQAALNSGIRVLRRMADEAQPATEAQQDGTSS